MMDPNLQDFYDRVARVQQARARGFGQEAPGALGRSYYGRRRRRGIPLIKPVLMAAVCVIGLKGTIHYYIGDGVYDDRVAALAAGDDVDRIGAWLMAADPATTWVSAKLQGWVPRR